MITAKDNAQVKRIRAYQTKKKERDRDGVFVAEGERLVIEAPDDLLTELYVSVSFHAQAAGETKRFLARHEQITRIVSDEVFPKMSDTKTPQGILAVLRQAAPPAGTTDTAAGAFLHGMQQAGAVGVALDGIQDTGNLGTILRSAEAAGASVLLSEDTADLYQPKCVRATMGSIYRVAHVRTEDLAATLRLLCADGVSVHAALLDPAACAYERLDYTKGRHVFVIGNEGNGIRSCVREACQDAVYLPMAGKTESLNAAVSASILLFEARRQQRALACESKAPIVK